MGSLRVLINTQQWMPLMRMIHKVFSDGYCTIYKAFEHAFCFFREIMPAVRKNKEQAKMNAAYNIVMGADMNEEEMIAANRRNADQMANVIDIR